MWTFKVIVLCLCLSLTLGEEMETRSEPSTLQADAEQTKEPEVVKKEDEDGKTLLGLLGGGHNHHNHGSSSGHHHYYPVPPPYDSCQSYRVQLNQALTDLAACKATCPG